MLSLSNAFTEEDLVILKKINNFLSQSADSNFLHGRT